MSQENADGVRRIRYYIFNQIRNHPTESIRLPSSYELAQMFGTTRRAAQLELERQIREGNLIARHRVGTFTLPARDPALLLQRTGVLPLIGVCFGNGDHFYYGRYENMLLSAVLGALSQLNCLSHDLRINQEDEVKRFEEIRTLGVNAVIWCSVANWMPEQGESFFHRFNEAGIPVGNFAGQFWDSASGADFTFRKALAELKPRFIREKRRRLAVFVMPNEAQRFCAELHELFPAPDFEVVKCSAVETIPENLCPDVLFFKERSAFAIEEFLHNRPFSVTRKNCLRISLDPFSPHASGNDFSFEFPYTEAARHLAAELLTRLATPSSPRNCRLWETQLIERK